MKLIQLRRQATEEAVYLLERETQKHIISSLGSAALCTATQLKTWRNNYKQPGSTPKRLPQIFTT
jgi:hypothetical protein